MIRILAYREAMAWVKIAGFDLSHGKKPRERFPPVKTDSNWSRTITLPIRLLDCCL